MTDRDIEMKLRRAIDNTAPDGLSRLLSEIDDRKGAVNIVEKTRKKSRWIGIAAACLALVLIAGAGGFYYGRNYSVATVVSLDVNPSVELKVNRSEKVISCVGLNDEGRAILSTMNGGADLEGARVNVAVNAIVGAIVKGGYLDSLSSAILISVEDRDAQRGAALQAKLVAEVDGVLQTAASSAGVLSQYITSDAGLNQQAQQNSISSGKAAYINQVIALNSSLEFDKLAELSVEELRDLILIGAPAMPIGKTQAMLAASEYAGVTALDSVVPEVDPELDDPIPHYEVELTWGDKYSYTVDAFTGQVLSGAENVLSTQQTPPSAPQTAISAEEAENAALAYFTEKHTEVIADYTVSNVQVEYDRDDNHYDVEFWYAGYEFDYTVDASTGAVLREDTRYVKPADTAPDSSQTQSGNQSQGSAGGTTAPGTGSDTDIGADAAKAAALEKAGVSDSSVTWSKCQREYDDGRLEYEIEFYTDTLEYEITVDAVTGEITKYETEAIRRSDSHHNDSHNSGASQTDDVGSDAAKAAALAHAGLTESQVTRLKCERDYDDGRIEYEVSFRSNGYEYEYKIDASTGAILEHEKDWDD